MKNTVREGITLSEEDANEYDRLKKEYENFHRLQYIYKIRLNS